MAKKPKRRQTTHQSTHNVDRRGERESMVKKWMKRSVVEYPFDNRREAPFGKE